MIIAFDYNSILVPMALGNNSVHKREDLEGNDITCINGFLFFMWNAYTSFKTNRFIICKEGKGLSKRKQLLPTYKSNRKQRDPKDESRIVDMYRQERILTEMLQEVGFQVESESGFEADDLLGSIAKSTNEEVTIITQDKDINQLVSSNVSVCNYRKNKLFTLSNFAKNFDGLTPAQFATRLAMTGDASDCVKGINGIGDKFATYYLKGLLDQKHRAYKNITNNLDIVEFNRKLVVLPFEGTPVIKYKETELKYDVFMQWCEKLGMYDISRGAERMLWKKILENRKD